MKKSLILRFVVYSLVFGTFFGCGVATKVAAKNCDAAAEKVSAAATAYTSDFTNKVKCKAYVDAITELINDCPTFYTGTTKQALLDFQKNACK